MSYAFARFIADDDAREPFDVEGCACIGATDKALHIRLPNRHERYVPISVVDEFSEVKKPGDSGLLSVAAWWVESSHFEDWVNKDPAPVFVDAAPAEMFEMDAEGG